VLALVIPPAKGATGDAVFVLPISRSPSSRLCDDLGKGRDVLGERHFATLPAPARPVNDSYFVGCVVEADHVLEGTPITANPALVGLAHVSDDTS
jgi:hypothetical protein